MRDQQLKVIIGSLLHDMGKVRYRAKDGRNHSISGVDFLQDEVGIKDADILDQVRYHHATLLKKSGVSKDSLCYITYIADNISSFSDRRAKEEEQIGFDKNMALESVFNLLNGNHGNAKYSPKTLSRKDGINMPTEKLIIYDDSFYQKISDNIQEVLKNLKYTDEYVNSLLEVLEANLSFVPSSTAKAEVADISLFDHMKMTSAIASCILDYLEENNISDYEKELLQGAEKFYDKQVFLLYSMDVSGIQSFIYHQYGNENVLKKIKEENQCKCFEYALNLDIKLRKQNYADFVRAITPLLVDLFELIIKEQTGVDINDYCFIKTKKKGNKVTKERDWDSSKLEGTEVLRALEEEYYQNFKGGFVKSDNLVGILKYFCHNQKVLKVVMDLRTVEENIRNMAAHQIVSVTEKTISNKTGFSGQEIMNLIKEAFSYTGIVIPKNGWESYDTMNQMIIDRM